MDVLSDVLREVRLTGAVFFDVHAGAPWIASTPGSASICARVMPAFEHVIAFHIMLDGRGWAQLADAHASICLDAGDAVIVAQGDGHSIGSDPDQRGTANAALYQLPASESLPFVLKQFGGQGAKARFVCGFLGCDAGPFNPVLDALPALLHVKRSSAAGILTHDLMRIALEESEQRRAGGEAILARISELMFLHAVRQHIDALPAESTGWLAALRDHHVRLALQLMHARPAHAWTLEGLGAEVGLSRTVFSERFTALMGIPAMQYLSSWRLQRAATLLDTQRLSLAQIAADVGFGSEAAFSRAFKRQVGVPPGAWRGRKEPTSSNDAVGDR